LISRYEPGGRLPTIPLLPAVLPAAREAAAAAAIAALLAAEAYGTYLQHQAPAEDQDTPVSSSAVPRAFLAGLVPHTGLTIVYLSFVLIGAQPALELLGAALLRRRQMPFALLGAQRVQFLLEGVVTRPGHFVGFSHYD
jgi:hypothetical protein